MMIKPSPVKVTFLKPSKVSRAYFGGIRLTPKGNKQGNRMEGYRLIFNARLTTTNSYVSRDGNLTNNQELRIIRKRSELGNLICL